jgi:hypothetical protein
MAEPKPSTDYIESVADEKAISHGPKETEEYDPNDPQVCDSILAIAAGKWRIQA